MNHDSYVHRSAFMINYLSAFMILISILII